MSVTIPIAERILRESRRLAGTVVTDAKAKRWDARAVDTYAEGDVIVATDGEQTADHANGAGGVVRCELGVLFCWIHRPSEADTIATDQKRTRNANQIKAAILGNRFFEEGGSGSGGTRLAFDTTDAGMIEAPDWISGQVDFVYRITVIFLHDAANPGTMGLAITAATEA